MDKKDEVQCKSLLTPLVRCAYPYLFKPAPASKKFPNSPVMFKITLLFPDTSTMTEADKDRMKKINQAIGYLLQKNVGDSFMEKLKILNEKELPRGFKINKGEYPEDVKKIMTPSSSADKKPQYLDIRADKDNPNPALRGKARVITEELLASNPEDYGIYGGVYVRALIDMYWRYGKLCVGLKAVQRVRSGPRLDGTVSGADAFETEELDFVSPPPTQEVGTEEIDNFFGF